MRKPDRKQDDILHNMRIVALNHNIHILDYASNHTHEFGN